MNEQSITDLQKECEERQTKKMLVTPVKIGDKIEIYAEIFGGSDLAACRITFKKIEELYKLDRLGDGLLTLTIDQARSLNADLTRILKE